MRDISINRLIPNFITIAALCFGLNSIRYALEGRWEFAMLMIVLAGILDGLDGRMARLLRASTPVGAQLDSLSDFACFGVAPAMLLYLWALEDAGRFGWLVTLALPVCAALRLARFNAGQEEADARPLSAKFFQGIASPAGAGLALMPIMISFEVGSWIADYPHLVGIWVILISLGMVSQLPTYSFKKVAIAHQYKSLAMVGAGLFLVVLVSAPWPTLIGVGVAQIASIPFSYRDYRRLERDAAMANVEPLHGPSDRKTDGDKSGTAAG
ncbi:MAG: phosphatidylcholine/phosphatidylserine synthase [Pseudomonadota bacterium]